MELTVEELPGGVTRAALSGRMDIEGAQAVDLKVNVLAGSKSALVIDLSGVTFLASMGLRTLMVAARTIAGKGGRLAVAGAQPNVHKVLIASGAGEVFTIAETVADAVAAVKAP